MFQSGMEPWVADELLRDLPAPGPGKRSVERLKGEAELGAQAGQVCGKSLPSQDC